MTHYLVTGGCGFIGSHLVDSLIEAGHRVRVLDDLSTGRRANVPAACEVMVGDVADHATVERAMAGVDRCFHLAAIASVELCNRDWVGTHRVNLGGTINVFDAARRHGGTPVPVVYASSAAVFGTPQETPLTETSPTRPISAYGADKLGCELHGHVAGLIHGVPTVGLRFFNIYGPRQDGSSPYSGVISNFLMRARDGRPVTINGTGTQMRDFVHVSDAVRFLNAAMAHALPEATVFNVCSGRPISIRALAETIVELAGRAVEITHGPARSGDIEVSIGDPTRAAERLGLRAEIDLPQGLAHTLAGLG